MYGAIILKDFINEKKKNSADFEKSYLAKNRFDGFESPWRGSFFKSWVATHTLRTNGLDSDTRKIP